MTQHKFTVEIELTEETLERLEECAYRNGTTVEMEIEAQLEMDTLTEFGVMHD